MKIAICDDCIPDLQEINAIISSHPKISEDYITLFSSSGELLNQINNQEKFDFVFLDIDMPDINGIELGKKIKKLLPNTIIVFITNYSEFAIDAFDCSAYHYLLKPISIEKINSILDELVSIYRKEKETYSMRTKSGYINLTIKDITYIESVSRHLVFHTNIKVYEVPGKISDVSDYFMNYGFCQTHQSILVNMSKITSIEKLDIFLSDGSWIPISQRKKAEVLRNYVNFLKEVNV